MAKTVSFGNRARPAPEDLDAFVHGKKGDALTVEEAPAPATSLEPAPVAAAPALAEEPPKAEPVPKPPMKRLTFDILATTHMRMKLACVAEGKDMAEELRALIEQKWPAKP